MKQNVLVIGSGGRVHALAWKLTQSSRVGKIYVTPGNGGTCAVAENVPSDLILNREPCLSFIQQRNINLVVVAQEALLAKGMVDLLRKEGIRVFGPTKAAACIESSKAMAKDIMKQAGVPTAAFCIFHRHDQALAYVHEKGAPIVIKADGLASGKGVYVCRTLSEAEDALQKIMVQCVHGNAGDFVVVEDFLEGQEISVHCLCDGTRGEEGFRLFPTAQDHKPLLDGDKGPNTGSMGAISPVPWAMGGLTMGTIAMKIVKPILDKMRECNRIFTGLLYPGIIATDQGFKVLEYNARFGDPETQLHMIRLETDLLDLLDACVDSTLSKADFRWYPGFAACVVMASGGYPGAYKKGFPIHGLDEAEKVPGVVIFHAGTTFDGQQFLTAGGRVLGVTARGETLKEAIDRAYQAVALIRFEGMQYRRDIGTKCL